MCTKAFKSLVGDSRQSEVEAAAVAGRAFSPDSAAVLLDDATAESEAETGATEGA